MPRIDVSESLYRQLEHEAEGGDIDDVLWKMVGAYRRMNNPESDLG